MQRYKNESYSFQNEEAEKHIIEYNEHDDSYPESPGLNRADEGKH